MELLIAFSAITAGPLFVCYVVIKACSSRFASGRKGATREHSNAYSRSRFAMDDSNRKTSAVPALSIAAISALQQRNKTEAIKIVREERNIGLKAAKDAVEDYVRSQPALQSSFAAAQAETKRTALRWLAMLIGLAILAYYLLAKP